MIKRLTVSTLQDKLEASVQFQARFTPCHANPKFRVQQTLQRQFQHKHSNTWGFYISFSIKFNVLNEFQFHFDSWSRQIAWRAPFLSGHNDVTSIRAKRDVTVWKGPDAANWKGSSLRLRLANYQKSPQEGARTNPYSNAVQTWKTPTSKHYARHPHSLEITQYVNTRSAQRHRR